MVDNSDAETVEVDQRSFRDVRRKHLLIGLFFDMILAVTIIVLPSFNPDAMGYALLALLLGILVAVSIQNLALSLTMNRFGVFSESFAPPVKPLSLRGRFVIALDDVETGYIIHQKEHGILCAVTLTSGKNIVFTTKWLSRLDWDWKDIEETMNALARRLGNRIHRFSPWQLEDKKSYELRKEREVTIDLTFAITIIGLGFVWMIAEGSIPGTEPWSRTNRALVTLTWALVGLIFILLLTTRRWLMWRRLLQNAREVTSDS